MSGNGCRTGVDRTQQGNKSTRKAHTGNARGYRGGAGAIPLYVVAWRFVDAPDYVYGTHGFRLAMAAQ